MRVKSNSRSVPILFLGFAVLLGPADRCLIAQESRTTEGDVPTGEIVRGEIAGKVHDYLGRLSGLGYSGGIILAIDGKVVLSHGYGMADRESGRRFTPDTVFSIGSIVKPLTGVGVMKLVEKGLVDVDDEVSEYFDDLPDDKADITIHELMTHSAGLPGAFGYDYEEYSREDLVQSFRECELLFVPGTSYEYSNPGFALLAAVIELVSGQDYDSYMREQVLEPAGMMKTGYRLDRYGPDEIAHGYRGDRDWGTVEEKYWTDIGPSWHLVGNGGIQSTLKDMFRFHLALEENALLSDDAKEEMFTPWVDEGGGDSHYGFGWVVQETERGTALYWHNGGNPYFSNDFRRYVDEDIAYYITSNNGAQPAAEVTHAIADMVFGHEVSLPPKSIAIDPKELAKRAGAYELDGGDRIHVKAIGGQLKVTASGQQAFSLVFTGASNAIERREKLTDRVTAAFEAAHEGDVATAAEKMGLPETWVRGELIPLLEELAEEQGEIGGIQGVGTISANKVSRDLPSVMEATLVRIAFEQGSILAVTVTFNGQYRGFDIVEMSDEVMFHPVSDVAFAAFSTRPPLDTAFRFDKHGDLVFEGPDGSVRAKRLGGT